jgi:hypothetical protein
LGAQSGTSPGRRQYAQVAAPLGPVAVDGVCMKCQFMGNCPERRLGRLQSSLDVAPSSCGIKSAKSDTIERVESL